MWLSESSTVTTGVGVRPCLRKFPPPHTPLDRKRGSGRFPDVAANQNQKAQEPGGAQLSPRPSPDQKAVLTLSSSKC